MRKIKNKKNREKAGDRRLSGIGGGQGIRDEMASFAYQYTVRSVYICVYTCKTVVYP